MKKRGEPGRGQAFGGSGTQDGDLGRSRTEQSIAAALTSSTLSVPESEEGHVFIERRKALLILAVLIQFLYWKTKDCYLLTAPSLNVWNQGEPVSGNQQTLVEVLGHTYGLLGTDYSSTLYLNILHIHIFFLIFVSCHQESG